MSYKTISWQQFTQIDIRAGTIIKAKEFPEAHKPAYKIQIDFGKEIGVLKSSAQITDLYSTDDLIGKQIIAVVNLPPKQIGPFISECLITGFYNHDNHVVLAVPDQDVPNGAKLQ